jgi:hypothetical protein
VNRQLHIPQVIQRKFSYFLCMVFFLITGSTTYALQPVVITESNLDQLHFWKGANLEILEDSDNTISFEEILAGKYDNVFSADKLDVPVTRKNNTTYWARVKIKKQTSDAYNWVFEVYDQSIDEVDFYAPDKSGRYVRHEGGDNRSFDIRQYQHKNFVFDLYLPDQTEQTVYLKIKAAHRVAFIGVVRNMNSFIGYALKEYFFLALFYGLVVSMIIFNLMQYFVTHQRIYLFYVLYVFTAALYSSSQDGLGFQFVWNALPGINNLFHHITSFFVVSFALLLCFEFLKETHPHKRYIQTGIVLIALRFVYMVLSIYDITLFPSFVIDTAIRLYILGLTLVALINGYRQVRYFTIAMSVLVVSYCIRDLTINGLFPNTILTVYMHLFGESIQMLFISLALGERIKIKMENLVINQEKSLLELEQTHLKTEELRKALQLQVEEQIAREKYVSDGISELGNIIANYLNDTQQLYRRIAKFVAEYFDCRLSALYLYNSETKQLELTSGYGLDENRLKGMIVDEGDGVLGQCAIDKKRIEIKDLPEDYISISSGLGSTAPNVIILEPLHFNQQLVGIIEMASFKEFTPIQYEVLDKFTAQIASTLSNVVFNETTRKMLIESRRKEEMLRQQEEEMRQQVEELIATQEEFFRKEEHYKNEIENLKK